jgi:hypothetical protein
LPLPLGSAELPPFNANGKPEMASEREKMEGWSLGELYDVIGNQNNLAPFARAELDRRQTIAQQEAFDAQKQAAEAQELAAAAAEETAGYTKASARYMKWSVIVLALSSLITAAFATLDHVMR